MSMFDVRESDVIITAAPKAGGTWMQQILHQLRTGGDESFRSIHDVVPWLDTYRSPSLRAELCRRLRHLPTPRIFKTHRTFEDLELGTAVSYVVVMRDPRDCAISYYHHLCD